MPLTPAVVQSTSYTVRARVMRFACAVGASRSETERATRARRDTRVMDDPPFRIVGRPEATHECQRIGAQGSGQQASAPCCYGQRSGGMKRATCEGAWKSTSSPLKAPRLGGSFGG